MNGQQPMTVDDEIISEQIVAEVPGEAIYRGIEPPFPRVEYARNRVCGADSRVKTSRLTRVPATTRSRRNNANARSPDQSCAAIPRQCCALRRRTYRVLAQDLAAPLPCGTIA